MKLFQTIGLKCLIKSSTQFIALQLLLLISGLYDLIDKWFIAVIFSMIRICIIHIHAQSNML